MLKRRVLESCICNRTKIFSPQNCFPIYPAPVSSPTWNENRAHHNILTTKILSHSNVDCPSIPNIFIFILDTINMAYASSGSDDLRAFEEQADTRSITNRRRPTDESIEYKSKNLHAERRRRQKLSDRLLLLRATVPIITNATSHNSPL